MKSTLHSALLLAFALATVGCDSCGSSHPLDSDPDAALADGAVADAGQLGDAQIEVDAGVDAGPPPCDPGYVDLHADGICTASICGDGFVDPTQGEACDSPNAPCVSCQLVCDAAEVTGEDASYAYLTSVGCFLFTSIEGSYVSFDDAETDCVARGGHLAAFETEARFNTFDRASEDEYVYGWAGARGESNATATWTSGSALAYAGRVYDPLELSASLQCAVYDGGWSLAAADCTELLGYVCEFRTCGDGVVTANEACDDGNLVDGDGCDSNCVVSACGNGVRDPAEDCDDGNVSSADSCPATCLFPCGSGTGAARAASTTSGCFLGFDATATWSDAELACVGVGGHLAAFETTAQWGDFERAITPFASYETDGWIGLAQVFGEAAAWSNGSVADYLGPVDDFAATVSPGVCARTLRGSPWRETSCTARQPYFCEIRTCGDGAKQANEACDDGNAVDGDGCDSNCTVSGCGNYLVDPSESCDDGNTVDGDGCDGDCQLPCGAGSGAERAYASTYGCVLDLGTQKTWAAAQTSCAAAGATLIHIASAVENESMRRFATPEAIWFGYNDIAVEGTFVWDGYPVTGYEHFLGSEPNGGTSENCGEFGGGGGWNDLNCNASRPVFCEIETCGNGSVESNEQCDDANLVDGDGCDTNCTTTACGNGVRAGTEACDDANLVDGDGCESTCTLVCGATSGAATAYLVGGTCYLGFTTTETFAGAEAVCVTTGGHLVSIGSLEENAVVVSLGLTDPYIGVTDSATEGTWLDTSGVTATFLNWWTGEPNNSNNEDCVVVSSQMGRWVDVNCAGTSMFACEVP